jgi:hypothetical protein
MTGVFENILGCFEYVYVHVHWLYHWVVRPHRKVLTLE